MRLLRSRARPRAAGASCWNAAAGLAFAVALAAWGMRRGNLDNGTRIDIGAIKIGTRIDYRYRRNQRSGRASASISAPETGQQHRHRHRRSRTGTGTGTGTGSSSAAARAPAPSPETAGRIGQQHRHRHRPAASAPGSAPISALETASDRQQHRRQHRHRQPRRRHGGGAHRGGSCSSRAARMPPSTASRSVPPSISPMATIGLVVSAAGRKDPHRARSTARRWATSLRIVLAAAAAPTLAPQPARA